MSEFRARDVAMYRPYRDEIPWELLLEADPDEARVYGYSEAVLMRVAKHEGRAVGAYVMQPLDATRFEILNFVVAAGYRRRGLGRWLLGHAIGLAESKGARVIVLRGRAPRGIFARVGFVAEGADAVLRLVPE